jgi:hypothetical protein
MFRSSFMSDAMGILFSLPAKGRALARLNCSLPSTEAAFREPLFELELLTQDLSVNLKRSTRIEYARHRAHFSWMDVRFAPIFCPLAGEPTRPPGRPAKRSIALHITHSRRANGTLKHWHRSRRIDLTDRNN